jgi:uncharacterized protein (DUF1778 family)
MQLQPFSAQVHEQLRAAAALGDDRTREVADALATAATPAVRLALLNAIAEAADEITAALLDYPGSPTVAVRLEGDEITVDVHAAATGETAEEPRRDDGDANARISLRLSETLKTEIDAAADRDGISVNTWLVRAATSALRPAPFGPGFMPGFGPGASRRPGERGRGRRQDNHHVTGWING